ncbi:MAG: hypothetical protein L0H83_15520 [Salinisphaera sp.]|nr:hypothetical protein [Salinisphaera sp.]
MLMRKGAQIIDDAMSRALLGRYDSPEARVMLYAIGMQESKFRWRIQGGGGPAHGYWQFEPNGVLGVLTHHAAALSAASVCVLRNVDCTVTAVYEALVRDDLLACAIARHLLWTDPNALPDLGDVAGAWDLYLRTWRPGKPRERDWKANYAQAMTAAGRRQ